jgi:hypothetical protein
MKQPLLAVLKLVHAKARAALAGHAATRRTAVALERSEEGRKVSWPRSEHLCGCFCAVLPWLGMLPQCVHLCGYFCAALSGHAALV